LKGIPCSRIPRNLRRDESEIESGDNYPLFAVEEEKRRGVIAVMGLNHLVVLIMCLNATLGIMGGGWVHGEMFKIDNTLRIIY
jgi:hypothetical protein